MALASTTGDDFIMGTDGDEILDGGAGNDTISLDLGDDTLIGGEGIDTIDASETTAGVTIQIGGSDGTVLNVSGDEVGTDVVPNVDFENVIGGSGNDFIFGNALVNNLAGGLGDDTIHSFGGADTIDGGEGIDTALFTAGGAVEVDLDDGGNATSSLGDTLLGIENINGSAANDDTLSGNEGPNQLFGNGGNDILNGEGGDDTLLGGDGDDTLNGGEGNDELVGNLGDDTVFGEAGDDLLVWNNGDGSDLLNGGEGDDTVQVNFQQNTDLSDTDLQNDDVAEIADTDDGSIQFNRVELNGQTEAGLFQLDIEETETLEVNFGGGNDTARLIDDVDLEAALQLDGGDGTDTLDLSEAGIGFDFNLTSGDLIAIDDSDRNDTATNFENAIGSDNDDFIIGSDADNVLEGGDGLDAIDGGEGNDELVGNLGDDTVFGEAGDDLLVWNNGDGSDLLNGGEGDDTVQVNFQQNTDLSDTDLQNDDVAEIADSDNGIQFNRVELNGQTEAGLFQLDIEETETLEVNFGGGNDTVRILGTALSDIALELDGGDGIDAIDLSDLEEGVVIDLDLNTPGETNTQEGAILDAPGGNVVADVIDFENVFGTQGDDLILGNNEINVLEGGAGDDAIHSFGGADTLDGGEGVDTALFTAGGGVTVDLDENGDAVSSFDDQLFAFENINGSAAGDDSLSGNDGFNQLFGNGGNDTLDGEGGADTLIGGDGDDLIVSDAIDTVFGGNEIDLEDPDADLITDDGGIDTIDFSTLEEGIADFGAFDGVIVDLDVNSAGPAGTPSQAGGILNAPPGAVAVEGVVPEENILQSVIDVENVIGSDFNDGLFGNNEVNILQGGAGNDAIHGFAGDDFLAGGEGTDTALFAAAPVGVIVDLNDQVSEADFAAIAAGDLEAIFAATGGAGNNVLSGFENVTGGAGDDDITGDDNDNILTGNGGNNILNGGAGTDTAVFSGNQADFEIAQADDGLVTVANLAAGVTDTLTDIEILSFADGDVTVADLFDGDVVDAIVGTAGADTIIGGLDIDAVADIILTGADDDTIDLPLATAEAADNIVLAGSGADQIFVSSGDIVSGGSGNDILDATDSSGGNRLSGGAGDDTLILGVAGGDRFLGGAGDDTFLFGEGGTGGNILAGGSGADIFALSPGEVAIAANIITDFDLAEDAFAGIGFADVTFDGNDVLVGDDVVATLLGVDATMLTEANFV